MSVCKISQGIERGEKKNRWCQWHIPEVNEYFSGTLLAFAIEGSSDCNRQHQKRPTHTHTHTQKHTLAHNNNERLINCSFNAMTASAIPIAKSGHAEVQQYKLPTNKAHLQNAPHSLWHFSGNYYALVCGHWSIVCTSQGPMMHRYEYTLPNCNVAAMTTYSETHQNATISKSIQPGTHGA